MRASLCLALILSLAGCQAESALDVYDNLLRGGQLSGGDEAALAEQWSMAQVPMALEILRFDQSARNREVLFRLLEEQTGQKFGHDLEKWQDWMWNQTYQPDLGYPQFKKDLYRQLDPKFARYFDKTEGAKIRLDEVVWGGVKQDGIPPLRNPKMLRSNDADYLGDADVVFGIEVGGEARAYPKRILAWHEMFTDTIQGVPLAGVY